MKQYKINDLELQLEGVVIMMMASKSNTKEWDELTNKYNIINAKIYCENINKRISINNANRKANSK